MLNINEIDKASMRRLSIVLVFFLLIQGCGLKFWYNRIDWIVPWYIDDIVELNDAQEKKLESLLVMKTEWHRAEELPKYVAWLEQLEQDIEQGKVADTYDQHSQQVIDFYQTIARTLIEDATPLLLELSKQQVDSMLAELEKDDIESREQLLEQSEQERLEDRHDLIRDNLRDWIGSLNDVQEQIVDDWAGQIQATSLQRYDYRKAWRQEFRNLLLVNPEPGSVDSLKTRQQKLDDFLLNPQRLQSESLKLARQHNRIVAKENLITLYSSLGPQQKKRLLGKLRDYREDFQDLMADS
jgi:hypothetical protein